MKALSVLSPSLSAKINKEDKYILELDSYKIPLALINIPDTEFNENEDKNKNAILVKKKGFSLNYRDLGIIENAWLRLKDLEQDTYYPVGSDFCGEILKIGKNVNNLKVGDYVIADCSYPISPFNSFPGIPSNHASKELEIFHKGKIQKIPKSIPVEQASGMSIGVQTAISMIKKANITEGDNILITSISSNTSLFILNFLREKKCNIYGLSYSGMKINKIKEKFPFIKNIYNIKENNIPKDLFFNIVFDPFSDTHLAILQHNLSFEAKYVTCGMYNQSSEKINSKPSYQNLPLLMSGIIAKNVNIKGNCLGKSEDLSEGVEIINNNQNSQIIIDKTFEDENDINEFIKRSFNISCENKLGKVSFLY